MGPFYTLITRAVGSVASGFHALGKLFTQDVRKWGSEYEPWKPSGRSYSINDFGCSISRSWSTSSVWQYIERGGIKPFKREKMDGRSLNAPSLSNTGLDNITAKYSPRHNGSKRIEQKFNPSQVQTETKAESQESYFAPIPQKEFIFNTKIPARRGLPYRQANLESVRESEKNRERPRQKDRHKIIEAPYTDLDNPLKNPWKSKGYRNIDVGNAIRHRRAVGTNSKKGAAEGPENGGGSGISNKQRNINTDSRKGREKKANEKLSSDNARQSNEFDHRRYQWPHQELEEYCCDGVVGCIGEVCTQHRICAIEAMSVSGL